MSDLPLSDQEISAFFERLEERVGVRLDLSKKYLLFARLQALSLEANYPSVGDFVRFLNRSRHTAWHDAAFAALTTNETMFFRDPAFFRTLQTRVLPALIRMRAGEKRLRIWSAAASSGQEAYSVAMMIRLHFPEVAKWEIDILGSDVSRPILARARAAVFSESEINRGLPTAYLSQFFKHVGASRYQLSEGIRSMVRFETFNLMGNAYLPERYDLIFLRNVLIYFSKENKSHILEKIAVSLAHDGGMLFLGGTESIKAPEKFDVDLQSEWTVYKKRTLACDGR